MRPMKTAGLLLKILYFRLIYRSINYLKQEIREGIRWLIRNGADLEKTDNMGYTSFHNAIC